MIDYGEVAFSSDCLFLAVIAVINTTGKYFMIEKVSNCKLSKNINYTALPLYDHDDDDHDDDHDEIETDNLLSCIDDNQLKTDDIDIVEIANIEMINLDSRRQDTNNTHYSDDPCIDTYNHQIQQLRNNEFITKNIINLNENNNNNERDNVNDNMISIPSSLTFAYILPLQIIIGFIVFMNEEFDDIMYNETSDGYKSVRSGWFWYSRIIQNTVFAGIYWAEIFLVGEFSALYMMVFGAIRNVSTLILSWIILKYELGMYGWFGYIIAIFAVSGFQYARKFDNKPI